MGCRAKFPNARPDGGRALSSIRATDAWLHFGRVRCASPDLLRVSAVPVLSGSDHVFIHGAAERKPLEFHPRRCDRISTGPHASADVANTFVTADFDDAGVDFSPEQEGL